MVSKTYAPAEPDAIAMADALDHEEDFDHTTTAAHPEAASAAAAEEAATLEPSSGLMSESPEVMAQSQPKSVVNETPKPDVNETSAKAQQMRETRAGLTATGRTYAPNQAAPDWEPPPKQVEVSEAPPAIGSLATVRPAFAGADPFANAAPALDHARGSSQPVMAPPSPIHQVTSAPSSAVPPPVPAAPPAPPAGSVSLAGYKAAAWPTRISGTSTARAEDNREKH